MPLDLCPDWPFIPNDWLASAQIVCLTPAEEGGLFRLLCYAWADPNCCLKKDEHALASMSRLGTAWAEGSGAKILALFEDDPIRPGFVFHNPQRTARREQMARVKKSRDQRINAAKSRWSNRGATASGPQCDRNATASGPQCENHASSPFYPLPSPVTHTHKEGKGRFAPPTLEEVKLQATKIGLPETEANKFWNHFQSNGWKVGGKAAMKDWIAALANWKLRIQSNGQPKATPKPKPDERF